MPALAREDSGDEREEEKLKLPEQYRELNEVLGRDDAYQVDASEVKPCGINSQIVGGFVELCSRRRHDQSRGLLKTTTLLLLIISPLAIAAVAEFLVCFCLFLSCSPSLHTMSMR